MSWSQIGVVGWLQFALASFGIFWLANYLLRRIAQPVDRIRIIQCTLAATTLLPLLIAAAPWHAWRLEIVSPVDEVTTAVSKADVTILGSTEIPLGPEKFTPMAFEERPIVVRSEVTETVVVEQKSAVLTSPPKPESNVPWTQVLARRAWTGAAILILGLHVIALMCFLGLRCVGRIQLHRLLRSAVPASEVLILSWNQLTHQRGHKVRLLVSSSLEVPVMYGWRRPVVLVPQKLANTGGAALTYCLAHEWSHIERHDFLAWRAVDACQILFWLQPAYWSLRKELRLCQDLLADDRSTPAAGDAIEYSALLVDFARQRMVTPVVGALTFMDQPSQLSRRVKMLLEQTFLMRTRCTWKFSLAAFMVAGLLVLAISGIRIDATRADENVTNKIESSNAINTRFEHPAKPADAVNEPPVELKYHCIVVDKETGKGIANANVIVRRFERDMGVDRPIEETKHVTDADGKYEVIIPPEQVAVSGLFIELLVDHKDYAERSGTHDHLRTMRKNEQLGDRPFFERTELYPGSEVTGTVVTPQGEPLAGVHIYGFSAAVDGRARSWAQARTTSNADGTFRVVFHKEGEAGLWIIPKDFAVVKRILATRRGDLGRIQLSPGVRMSGQVLNVDRAPVAGVPVNIEYADTEDLGTLPASSTAFRQALTDPEGRFTLDPLPPGNYRVTIDDHFENMYSMDRSRFTVPAIFIPKKIRLHAGSESQPLEIQAVPHVVINVQNFNSAGEKSRGGVAHINGTIDGEFWTATAHPKQDGSIALKVPHGLLVGEIQFGINERDAIRYRLGKGQPLLDGSSSKELGTLNDDIECIEVYRFKAPIVLVSAVGEDRKTIAKPEIKAKYTKSRPDAYVSFANGSDIYIEAQTDGKFRTRWMLPDEEVTFSITADGYKSVEEKINLKEGETKDLVLTLKRSDEPNDAKTSQAEPTKEPLTALKYNCIVVDKVTGKGIANANVTVRRTNGFGGEDKLIAESKHVTDADGKYEVVFPPDQLAISGLMVEIIVDHKDYAGKNGEFEGLRTTLRKEKLGDRPFFERTELYPGAEVTGSLITPDGQPLGGVPIYGFSASLDRNPYGWLRARTTSNTDGSFRIVFHKDGDAGLWMMPRDFAVVKKILAGQRGDLGQIRLSPGVRLSGQVLTVDRSPVVGVPVNIGYAERDDLGSLPMSSTAFRHALTDQQGRFTLDPLPPGDYRVSIDDHFENLYLTDYARFTVPAIFIPKKIRLNSGNETENVEIQAVPHVVINIQNLNSAGEKTRGNLAHIYGTIDGESWQAQSDPQQDGTIALKVPHGLRDAQIQFGSSERDAIRFRLGKGQPLRDDWRSFQLETLQGDIEGIEVIRYKAPIALISVIGSDGKAISKPQIKAKYAKPRPAAYISFANDSDITLDAQTDGKFRTRWMLPDEDMTFTIAADGYKSVDEKINLKEGEIKELTFTLKKVDESNDAKTSLVQPAKEPPAALKYFCSVIDKETGNGIPNARVVVRRSILTAIENRILEESKHITDGEGKYVVNIPPEQVAEGALYIQLDVQHDDYVSRMGHGSALAMIRKNEKLGERPFFEQTILSPAEPVFGTVISSNGNPMAAVKVQGFTMSKANEFRTSSFFDCLTDEGGKFRLNYEKDAEAVLWVIPKDFAPMEISLGKKRGDLGELKLAAGIRVTGRVLGIDRQPIVGVPVNIDYSGEREVTLPVSTSVRRGVLSDSEGRFAFDPLPKGKYRLTVDDYLQDSLLKDGTRYSVPAIFQPRTVELKAIGEPAFQELQAVPHVLISAQNLNSKGEKIRGFQFHLSGRIDGEPWFGSGRPNEHGAIVLKVPHGLQKAQINLTTNEHGALRFRLGPGKPLRDDVHMVQLGTLNDDIEGVEVIQYKAPIVLVSAFDKDQKPIKQLEIKATYAKPRPAAYVSFANKSDVAFERQNDGKYRTKQMLPDEDLTFSIAADGYLPIEKQINLKEGETNELVVTLSQVVTTNP